MSTPNEPGGTSDHWRQVEALYHEHPQLDRGRDGETCYRLQRVATPPRAAVTQIQLVTHWAQELKAQVAAGQPK